MIRKIKCNSPVDCCRRGLDRGEPLFSLQAKMQTQPSPTRRKTLWKISFIYWLFCNFCYNLVSSLIKPSKGTIDLVGDVGYMFQKDNLLEWRTIYKNITIGLEIKGKITKDQKDKILKRFAVVTPCKPLFIVKLNFNRKNVFILFSDKKNFIHRCCSCFLYCNI